MKGLTSPDRKQRLWQLVGAVLIVLAVGVAYLLKWQNGLRSVELLQFFTIYLSVPLAVGLLLLFAYLRPVRS